MKKIVSFLLTLVLLLSLVPTQLVTVVEAANITNRKLTILNDKTSNIAPGVTLNTVTARKQYNKQQLVYYSMEIDLDPKNQVEIYANYFNNDIESVMGGKYGLQVVKDQMDAAAKNHEDEKNFNIVAGMNGTGYVMATGNPHAHVLIMEGKVIQGAENTTYKNFFGIRKNGEAMIGWDVNTYNQVMASDNPLVEAVGGFSGVLIEDGNINPDCDWSKSETPDCNARTAIGVSQDGKKVVMLVVDGKQAPTSEGCDMYELAEILQDAGCYNAVNMDGGGSTTMVARPEGKENYEVISSPCDGAPRAVASSFYVVSRVPPSDEAHHAAVEADADYITPNGTVNITTSALNYAGTAVDMPEDAQWVEAGKEPLGTITGSAEDAVFTSNGTVGDTTLELRCESGQKLLATVPIHVVVPTEFKFTQSTFALPYGKTIDITFNATYKVDTVEGIDITRDVKLRKEDVSMSISSDELGELVDYTFTAAGEGASNTTEGIVTAKLIEELGSKEITAKLLIGKETETVMGFEEDATTLSELFYAEAASGTVPLNVPFETKIVNRETGKVHDGNQALAVTFDFTHVNSSFEGSGWFSNFVKYNGERPTRSNVTGYGFWVWIPDEAKQVQFKPVLRVPDGRSFKNVLASGNDPSFASEYDEGHWCYFEIDKAVIEPYVNGEVSVPGLGGTPFYFYFQASNAAIKPANLNNKITFYIDTVQMDYSPITPDRGMPNIMSVNDGATGGELLRGNTYTYTSNDPVNFTATVVDDNGLNATGIRKVEAFVDGVPVDVTYDPNTHLATTTATKFAPGAHTLKFYAYDGAEGTPNCTNATRRFVIPEDQSTVTVKMTAKDGPGNVVGADSRIPIGSIVNIGFETTDISKIDGVSMDLDLNNNGTWYLENATVNPKFTMTSKLDPVENIATITLTRNAVYEDTDKAIENPNVLVSIPVRTWEIESSFTSKWDSSTLTIEGLWSSGTFCRVQVEVDVDRGEITYAPDYVPGVLNTFGSAHLAVDTELFGKSADVKNAYPNNTRWHEHTNLKDVPTSEATCTTDGYAGQTYCEECHSVVNWGTKTPATGHSYEVNAETGLMQCTVCDDLYTGELGGITYVNGKTVEGWQDDNTYYVNGKPLGEGLHETNDTVDGETVTRMHRFDADGKCIDRNIAYTGFYTKDAAGNCTAVENLPTDAAQLDTTAYYYVEGGLPYDGWLYFWKDGGKADLNETKPTETIPDGEEEKDKSSGEKTDAPTAMAETSGTSGTPEREPGMPDPTQQQKILDIRAYHIHKEDRRVYRVDMVDTRKCVVSGYIEYTCTACKQQTKSEKLWWVGHDWDENHVCRREDCKLVGRDIGKASLNIMGERFDYTGGLIRAAVYVYDNNKSLLVRSDKNGTDGYVWYENNQDIGVATVHIRGEGDYYGELTGTFEIVPKSVKEVRKSETHCATADEVTVNLDWDESPGATYYDVFRYDYVAKQWITTKVTTNHFSEELPLGTEYGYVVASRAEKDGKTYLCALWSDSVYGVIGHRWGAEQSKVEPGCETEGSYTHECTECHFVETVTVPATGHKVDNWTTTVAPTYTSSGSRTGTCSVCGEEVTETLSPIPPVITGTGNTTSPDAKQETVENEDGSTTTTTTKPDGSTTETTTQTDGTVTEKNTDKSGVVTETTTKPDNTVTEKVTQTDGSATERTTTPDGVVGQKSTDSEGKVTSAEVVIPKEAEKQDVVTAPVEVPAAKTAEEAPEISVRTESTESKKVEIPVTEFGPGTVAVIVHEDGTEEVVRDCTIGENGVVLNVEGDVTLKIVDKAETFEDVEDANHWASNAVEFVAARELFNGTAENKFTPNGSMTRGMMVTVLYRLAYEPDAVEEGFADVKSDAYYSDAVAWAAENGVVNGYADNTFAPDDNVSREQLVTILHRYAQKKGYATNTSETLANFADAKSVSSWAADAMSWAVELGLVNGTDSTHISPAKSATRAEVATILMRFCEKVVK